MTTYKILKPNLQSMTTHWTHKKKSNSKLVISSVSQLHNLNTTMRTKYWMKGKIKQN